MNKKKVKLVALLAVFSMLVCGQLTRKSEADSAGQNSHRAEVAGIDSTLSQRLGADDNPTFLIHFTGDIHGSLAPCG